MTNEEAINVLRNAAWLGTNEQREEVEQAVEVATEALQKQYSYDCISRQAAIDALRTCQTYLFDTYDPDKKISLESAEFEIEQLSSAQPEIIRCKDCANCSRDAIFDDYWCGGREVEANHYCSFAERRTDDSISD